MKDYSSLFMDIAERTAKESNCIKLKVGAVAVKDNRIVAQGYNGTVSGFQNCSEKFGKLDFSKKENRELHHNWSSSFEVHAEMNVISFAAKNGISLENATIYCTHCPCNNCLKHLIQTGVKKVIFKHDYIDNTNLADRKEFMKFIEVQIYE